MLKISEQAQKSHWIQLFQYKSSFQALAAPYT